MRHGSVRLDEDGDDESFELGRAKELIGLVWRAPARRPRLAATLFLLVSAASFFAARRVAPLYEAEAIIVVQKSVVVPTFGEGGRTLMSSDFDPSQGVEGAVKRRENLVALVRQTHLVERLPALPGAPPMSRDEKAQHLARMLDARLNVRSDGNNVTFTVDWTDPESAFDLVSSAVQSFFTARNEAEVSIISDAIALLEEHARAERDGIDTAMQEFIHLKDGWKTATPALAPLPGGQAGYRPRPPGDPSIGGPDGSLAKRLEEKKLQIKETEDERRRQLSELKGQLAGLLGTYTPSYPPVIALQRKIDALSEEPPSLTSLKSEERVLLNEIASTSAPSPDARNAPGGRPFVGGAAVATPGRPAGSPNSRQDLEISDPASAMALSKVQNRIHKYEEFMDQISAAKLELDLARNAFKNRYGMYKPPELPTRPKRPIALIVGCGGTFAALLLAFAASALLDLLSGRFIESWQVKRKLSLPVLGEVTRP